MSRPTDERYTPATLMAQVRQVIGDIDLDPCSCAAANRIVKAKRYFTEDDEPLEQAWVAETLWLNWPASRARAFSQAFRAGLECAYFDRAAVMIFNLDPSTDWFKNLAYGGPMLALLDSRTKFSGPDGRLYDVGRGQAIAFYGVAREAVEAAFPNAYVVA